MSQKVVTTKNVGKKDFDDTANIFNPTFPNTPITKQSSSPTNTTSNPSKTTSSNPKMIDQTPKPNASSTSMDRLEYDFLEDLKKTKANIPCLSLWRFHKFNKILLKLYKGKLPLAQRKLTLEQITKQQRQVIITITVHLKFK